MGPVRQRWIIEAPAGDRRPLSERVLERLKEAGTGPGREVTTDTPLTEGQQAAVKATLGTWGRPGTEVKTWGQALEAFTGDVDADGKVDIDIDALAGASLVQAPQGGWQAMNAATGRSAD